jgi:drug/metabolite transporter (DMT)-like permease
MLKTAALVAGAMVCFAANSVLARLALGAGEIDALAYTGIRMAAGAVVLGTLMVFLPRYPDIHLKIGGGWAAATALLGYAALFSLAYLMLGAGTGALILFAAVQFGMIGWAIFKGDRPGGLEWAGLFLALMALVWLVSPGVTAPKPVGAVVMAGAGFCWAAYTLIGRGSTSPLADTAGNFIRSAPAGIVLLIAGLSTHPVSAKGIAYAVASGAIASGMGYAVWYAVLPKLSRTRAALVQLTVPAIAALGGAALLSETLSPRLVVSALGILGGVGIAVVDGARRRG